jgi:type II secretory ATPase GspE/PulE/Tfp pilus assembly ATPase PilB-like protein
VGIFEMLLIGDEIRALITQNTDAKTLKRKAMELGMHTLRSDGARKVLAGITSVAEVLRATEDEGVVAEV